MSTSAGSAPVASRSQETVREASSVADVSAMNRSSRSAERASKAKANARSVSRSRSWNSSMTRPATPGSSGSRCKRRNATPGVTISTRVRSLTLESPRTE